VSDWLIDAADLLGEPDPGPTPWLVDGLIVDQALAAVVGKWKTTKSWGMLEVAISIATGSPAFGAAAVTEPGPVVYVIEESGRHALWRVKLDDPDWQQRLLKLGHEIRPRAFIFDPLARMKDARREENDQTGMAPVIEYLRLLRDETQAAALFVHHTGHSGEHMRGSSDLESVWESRLAFKRDTDNGIVTVKAEHRDEESSDTVVYVLDWHHETRTMRLRPTVPPLAERIIDHLRDNGPMGATELAKGIETRRQDVDRVLAVLEEAGTTRRAPSDKPDATGRHNPAKVWHLNDHAELRLVPESGRNGTPHPSAEVVGPSRPAPLGADEGRDAATGARDGVAHPPRGGGMTPTPQTDTPHLSAKESVVVTCGSLDE
jgi:hypothetical protein